MSGVSGRATAARCREGNSDITQQISSIFTFSFQYIHIYLCLLSLIYLINYVHSCGITYIKYSAMHVRVCGIHVYADIRDVFSVSLCVTRSDSDLNTRRTERTKNIHIDTKI